MTAKQNKESLLIVGSVAFDSVETPNGSVEMALGGSASYASIAASYFAHPMVVGVVGEDFGPAHFAPFEEHQIDTSGIEKLEGKTFHWRGRYHENFKERDTLETSLNVFETFDPSVPASFREARYVFLANIAPSLQLKVLDQTRSTELVAMDTMNFWIETAKDELRDVISRVDLLFVNDEEALMLSGQSSVLGAAETILGWGPKYVVIKRGEYGAVLFGPGVRLFVPALLLSKVVDPTGAGDTFAGGFLGLLSQHDAVDRSALAKALRSGTVLASFAVEAFSVDGICGLGDSALDERHRELSKLIDH